MRKLCIVLGVLVLCAGYARAEEAVSLDAAIKASVDFLVERLPEGNRTAVINWGAPTEKLSDYIIDELNSLIANDGKLIAINRRDSELLAVEKNYQLSGEVSDETAAAIGRELGVETVIRGSVVGIGTLYRLQLQAIDVETAQISGGFGIDIKPDGRLNALVGKDDPGQKQTGKQFSVSIGARFGAGIHSYKLSKDIKGSIDGTHTAFEPAVFAAIPLGGKKIIPYFQIEVIYTSDSVVYTSSSNNSFESTSLLIPLLAKLTFPINNKLSINPLAGVYFTIPLSKLKSTDDSGSSNGYTFSAPMGITLGADIGYKLGIGTLFADIRYSSDFGNTGISDSKGSLALYQRSNFSFALGYDITFVR